MPRALRSILSNLNRSYYYLRALLSRQPNYLILFVTARCNLRCPHCFYLEEINSAVKSRELRLDEFEKISRSLPYLLQLTCTGGETFVRKDIDAIAQIFYRNSNTRFFTFTTNGTFAERTAEKVEAIAKSCPRAIIRVPLSLDGVGPVHDRARGREGVWEQALDCYRRLREVADRNDNVRLDVTTVLSQLNQEDAGELVEYVHQNMRIENHTLLFARGAIQEKEKIVPRQERYQKLIARLAELNNRVRDFPFISRAFVRLKGAVEAAIVYFQRTGDLPFVCQAGERLIEMSEYGEVFPCELLDTLIKEGHANPQGAFKASAFGNVRDFDYDLGKLMNSAQARRVRDFIQAKGCACSFECALGASIVFEPKNLHRMLRTPGSG